MCEACRREWSRFVTEPDESLPKRGPAWTPLSATVVQRPTEPAARAREGTDDRVKAADAVEKEFVGAFESRDAVEDFQADAPELDVADESDVEYLDDEEDQPGFLATAFDPNAAERVVPDHVPGSDIMSEERSTPDAATDLLDLRSASPGHAEREEGDDADERGFLAAQAAVAGAQAELVAPQQEYLEEEPDQDYAYDDPDVTMEMAADGESDFEILDGDVDDTSFLQDDASHEFPLPFREELAALEEEDANAPLARFMCPQCERPELVADLVDDMGLARCENCRYEADDLLALIPVRPVGLLELTIGSGAGGIVRGASFVIVCALLLSLIILGR